MEGPRVVFTECWFLVNQVWVDVHIVGAPDDPQPRRVGRFIFSGSGQTRVWGFLRRVLKGGPHDPLVGPIEIAIARGNPDTINYAAIPAAIMNGIAEHIVHGRPSGDYLTAVLQNNLGDAVGRADEASLAALRDTVIWLCNNAPIECWTSPEKVRQWRLAHRMAESLGVAEQGPRPTEAPAAATEATP